MKARNLIYGAVYGPDAIKVIAEAFESAWGDIASRYDGAEEIVERVRLRLAHAVLAVADENSRDVGELKQKALQVMSLNWGGRAAPGSRSAN
jgi:hypothetical protein